MNSGDVHRHQAHPPLAQHVGLGGGWYTASPVPPAPLAAAPAAPAPTAPARVKRLQPPPHQLPSGGGGGGGGGGCGAGAPLSPSAPHNTGGMSSSVRILPSGGAPIMHTSQGPPSCCPWTWGEGGVGGKGASDLLVSGSVPPSWLANMHKMPWHHGKISRERAEQLLGGAADGVFLVRESTNFPGDHTLCVRYRGRVEHYRVKWAPAVGPHPHRLTIDDEEFFCDMASLIDHYLKDADGLCIRLARCLPKQTANGPPANHSSAQQLQPAYSASQPAAFHPPHSALQQPPTQAPSQPAPFPPAHVPPGAQPAFSARMSPPHATHAPHTYINQPAADQTDSVPATSLQPQDFADLGLMIPERDLLIRENIGKGEFGDVMLGILNGKQNVAVKILKDSKTARKFLPEASVMTTLKDDNLVQLLGLVFCANGSTWIVTEHMAQGSLLDYLRSRGRHYVTQRHQINFAYDACCGMEYLEKRQVVHRDLAARNVLIARDGTAKVADFGLARSNASCPDEPHLQAKLPIKWTAPEALKYSVFSNKSDMWSFGILLWEIYSFGRVPYPRIPLVDVVRAVERGYRMEAPEGCPPEPYEAMKAAWQAEPQQRPTFQQTRQSLRALRDATPAAAAPPALPWPARDPSKQ